MFINMNGYQLGKRDDGQVLDDVKLPKWAKNPEHFINLHRQALECELVSSQLHQWIDLIFGYKQRGPEAIRATNVFYYLTYEGSVDLNKIHDKSMRQALENQMRNFGQTPSQLLPEPHPPRQSLMTLSPMMFQPIREDLTMLMKFISNSPVIHLSANTFQHLQNPTVVSVTTNMCFALNRWNNTFTGIPQGNITTGSLGEVTKKASSPDTSSQQSQQQQPNLPLVVDPLLATGNPANPPPKRHLGEAFDQRLSVRSCNFITTLDSKYIIACGYTDYSFRVIDTDNARIKQVVYGHRNVVSAVTRSECNLFADFFVATGSLDCTVLLWHWSSKNNAIAGDSNTAGENASARAVLTGHDSHITSVTISAEHGLVISGSKGGVILVHTTQGDLLRSLSCTKNSSTPLFLSVSRDCLVFVAYQNKSMTLLTAADRLLAKADAPSLVECFCVSRDGEYLVTGDDTGLVSVYRLFGLERLFSYQKCNSAVKSIALAQNHRFILAGLASGSIVVFNIDFNKWHHEYKTRYSLK